MSDQTFKNAQTLKSVDGDLATIVANLRQAADSIETFREALSSESQAQSDLDLGQVESLRYNLMDRFQTMGHRVKAAQDQSLRAMLHAASLVGQDS